MTARSLTEAIYQLGCVSRSRGLTNPSLLRTLADLTSETCAADVVVLAVFESGIEGPTSATCVRGPWSQDARDRYLEQAQWGFDERLMCDRLAPLRRGRLHHRPDLMFEAETRAPLPFNGGASPLSLGDHAAGLFRRSDGAELLLSIHRLAGSGTTTGPFTRTHLARAGSLAPFVAQCWAVSWRAEARWMADLKPQTRMILESLLQGYDDDQIAQRTGLSYHSVRAHLKRLFREAGVRSRLHLMQTCNALAGGPELTVEIPAEDQLTHAIG